MADADLTTNETSEAPADDIRSALNAALEQAETPQRPAPEPEAAEAAPERARDEHGRFAKAEQPEAEPPAEAPERAPEAEEKPEEPAAPKEPDAEFAKSTARWSATDKAMLAKLPEDAQQFLVRRHREMEADHTRKTQEIADFRRDYAPIDQLFAPHADALRQRGFTKASLIQAWYNVEQSLMKGGDPAASLVANIVQNYNIDRGAVARALGVAPQAPVSQQPATPQDPAPEIAGQVQPTLPPEVVRRLEDNERVLRALATAHQDRERAAQLEAANRVMSEIDQFAQATDSAGALLHPYFREVENDMALLTQVARASGKTPILSELYEQAVWANPSVRAKMFEAQAAAEQAQRAEAEKKSQAEARAKAEKARRAASSVTGAPGSGQPGKANTGSLRDQLMAAVEQAETA